MGTTAWRRYGVLGAVVTLLVGGLAAGGGAALARSSAAGATPVAFTDGDHDGIDDGLEQLLADRFAPVVILESDESNYPVNVEWFLQRARMEYHEDCASDTDDAVGPNPLGSQAALIGPPWSQGPHCGEDDTGYSHPPHRLITTVAADPDGQVSAGAATTGYSDQQTFVLPDLADAYHVGSLNPQDWKTYFHAYPTADHGIMLQYWHLFAYNELSVAGFGRHGGDWDATIHVHLGPDLNVEKIWFSRHGNDHPGDAMAPGQVTTVEGSHPLMTIDGGGHAAFASPADFCANRSVAGGTAAWPTDMSDPLNPAKLAAVDCGGFPVLGPLFSADHPGGTLWRTWDGGTVVASGGLTHPIASPSGHGGMVNLGEYNPCTPVTCYGSRQASTLLAGQAYPLNDQIFIRYEGRWGSLPHCGFSGCADPPRGPVFQGAEDTGSEVVYRAWYNEGANEPASAATSPWRQPPTTTRALNGPTYAAGGTTYVSASSTVSFSVASNPVAAGFGQARTYYRVYPAGTAAPAFRSYDGPFSLPGPDGAWRVDFYSVDALHNEEAAQGFQLTLDATPPAVTVTQPAAAAYPHSATITLDYGAADGGGSGVAAVSAILDGAPTLAGHGLAPGQVIHLLTELRLGTHTFAVTAADHVGNTGGASVTFSVVVTPESITEDVRQFADAGAIDANTVRSLLAKLQSALAARNRGQCATAANVYQAFVNELRAQSGKKVGAAAAEVMSDDARYLIAHCP